MNGASIAELARASTAGSPILEEHVEFAAGLLESRILDERIYACKIILLARDKKLELGKIISILSDASQTLADKDSKVAFYLLGCVPLLPTNIGPLPLSLRQFCYRSIFSSDFGVRITAAKALNRLFSMGDSLSQKLLNVLLEDADQFVRKEAALILRKLKMIQPS